MPLHGQYGFQSIRIIILLVWHGPLYIKSVRILYSSYDFLIELFAQTQTKQFLFESILCVYLE